MWRVLERSDVVVQIVDARNPLLFWCEDLSKYVKEISENKLNLVLLNKADYLSEKQREYWFRYFSSLNMHVAFFSAMLASTENASIPTNENNLDQIKEEIAKLDTAVQSAADSLSRILVAVNDLVHSKGLDGKKYLACPLNNGDITIPRNTNSSKILSRAELISYLKTLHTKSKTNESATTVGLVGYPNVGKSSTINALLTMKKVSVSATPGKTKHFQTLHLDDNLVLCDCPGLVMPSFVYTKAEMIINGILPVDQMRDHVPPINLISNLIPRHVIEDQYGIMLPKPLEGEDVDRCPTAEEILNCYACKCIV